MKVGIVGRFKRFGRFGKFYIVDRKEKEFRTGRKIRWTGGGRIVLRGLWRSMWGREMMDLSRRTIVMVTDLPCPALLCES